MLKVRQWQLGLTALYFSSRVKLTLFARDGESGSDLEASKIIEMINSGEAEGLEQYGFKVESASASKYHSFAFNLLFYVS